MGRHTIITKTFGIAVPFFPKKGKSPAVWGLELRTRLRGGLCAAQRGTWGKPCCLSRRLLFPLQRGSQSKPDCLKGSLRESVISKEVHAKRDSRILPVSPLLFFLKCPQNYLPKTVIPLCNFPIPRLSVAPFLQRLTFKLFTSTWYSRSSMACASPATSLCVPGGTALSLGRYMNTSCTFTPGSLHTPSSQFLTKPCSSRQPVQRLHSLKDTLAGVTLSVHY